MNFRIAGRHDSLLLAGFTFALLVIFQRSVQYLFSVANDIERTYGVALIRSAPARRRCSRRSAFGIATSNPGEQVDALLDRADCALYAAKAAGRNCTRASVLPTRSARPVTQLAAVAR